jgi:MFS family permease
MYSIKLTRRVATFGAALQAGSVNVGMMIAGRFFAGLGCGMLLTVVPVYIAEVSPPKQRGTIVGLQGMMIAIGFFLANWVGYGGDFASGMRNGVSHLRCKCLERSHSRSDVSLFPIALVGVRITAPQLVADGSLTVVLQWSKRSDMRKQRRVCVPNTSMK